METKTNEFGLGPYLVAIASRFYFAFFADECSFYSLNSSSYAPWMNDLLSGKRNRSSLMGESSFETVLRKKTSLGLSDA